MRWIDRARRNSPSKEEIGDVIGKILTDVITAGIIVFIGSLAFSFPWLLVGIVFVLSVFVRTGLADKFNK